MPHIPGERIVLREYRREDLPHMRAWTNDAEITEQLSDIFLFAHTLEMTESFLSSMLQGTGEMKGFVIADAATLDYIGQIDLHHLDWKNRSATVGMVIGRKELLGQGYGREAMRLMQRFVFHSLNMHRLELTVYEYNERAMRSYAACGFVEEGRLRGKQFRRGRYWDVVCMSMLQDEYERQTAAATQPGTGQR